MSPRSLLFIATRPCREPRDGRSRMLRQWVDSLKGRFVVHYAYMADGAAFGQTATQSATPAVSEAGASTCVLEEHWIEYTTRNPSWFGRGSSLIRRRGRALQEHYFWNRGFSSLVNGLAAKVNPDIIVVDMARMYQYVPPNTTARVIVDLDDLLSLRYERMLHQGKHPTAGRFATDGTHLIESAMRYFPSAGRRILKEEMVRIEALETRIVEKADAVVMTSPVEANQLRAETRSGAKIVGIPPGFEIMSSAAGKQLVEGKVKLGFFGNLDYGPNLESLEFLNSALAPMLESNPSITLTVAGSCSDPARLLKRLSRAVTFMGTVGKPQEFYESADIVLAPIFSGSGIRTKVLEAFAYGRPVIGTSMAFEGIELPGLDRYKFETLDDLLVRIKQLLANWGDTIKDVQAFQTELLAHHSNEQVRNLYLSVCERAMPVPSMKVAAMQGAA